MKPETEIRRHRDNLRTCSQAHCGCAGTQHALECHIGGKMMIAVIETLSWALGEAPEMQEHVDRLQRDAKRTKAGEN